MNANRFLDNLFGKYASMTAKRFKNRCVQMGKNPTAVKDFYISKGCISIINAGDGIHYNFINYIKNI